MTESASKLVYALVPARSGSKGLPDKNVTPFLGRPLLLHSVEQGVAASSVHATFISTDSSRYRDLAVEAGAEGPFLRPSEISGDLTTDFEVFKHFIDWLEQSGRDMPSLIVHLRPTYPLRAPGLIDRAVAAISAVFEEADSLRSVVPAPATPYKMWRSAGSWLEPLLDLDGVAEPFNSPRQLLPEIFWQNACLDIYKPAIIAAQGSLSGRKILKFEMDPVDVFDIDDAEDLARAERAAAKRKESGNAQA